MSQSQRTDQSRGEQSPNGNTDDALGMTSRTNVQVAEH